MTRGKKIVLYSFLSLVGLFIAGVILLLLFLGSAIRKGVETVGPQLTGCPIKVQDVSISMLRGTFELNGLDVGNPEGFKTPSAFKVKTVRVALEPKSVLSDRILIHEIFIDGPEVTYEVGLSGSNIGKIQKNVETATGGGKEKPAAETAPAEKKPGKKVQIDVVTVRGGKINLSSTVLGGSAVPIPLPEVNLKDIGKDKEGASIGDAAKEILGSITGAITNAVTGSGKLLQQGADSISGAAKDTGKAVKDGAAGLLKSVGLGK